MSEADRLIRLLDLKPHPEGGWYRETWRTPSPDGKRAAASAVYYLIQPGQRSHWNRVDADEMWLWHAGDAVEVAITKSDLGAAHKVRLGGKIEAGEHPQVIVPAGQWQSADPKHPSQLWYDRNGKLLGADFSILLTHSTSRPNVWGINPGRWAELDGHQHWC